MQKRNAEYFSKSKVSEVSNMKIKHYSPSHFKFEEQATEADYRSLSQTLANFDKSRGGIMGLKHKDTKKFSIPDIMELRG